MTSPPTARHPRAVLPRSLCLLVQVRVSIPVLVLASPSCCLSASSALTRRAPARRPCQFLCISDVNTALLLENKAGGLLPLLLEALFLEPGALRPDVTASNQAAIQQSVAESLLRIALFQPGMLTQGGQGGRPAPSAPRLHRIPAHFLLNLHGV